MFIVHYSILLLSVAAPQVKVEGIITAVESAQYLIHHNGTEIVKQVMLFYQSVDNLNFDLCTSHVFFLIYFT